MVARNVIILAGGNGSRVARISPHLPKPLLPLGLQPVLVHQLNLLGDSGYTVVIAANADTAPTLRDFIEVANLSTPSRPIIVYTLPENAKVVGPGASAYNALMFAETGMLFTGDDLLITACDTLWSKHDLDEISGESPHSHIAVASIPPGTTRERWSTWNIEANRLDEKLSENVSYSSDIDGRLAYTGLLHVNGSDRDKFRAALARQVDHASYSSRTEMQLTSAINDIKPMPVMINWTDTGDETSYRAALMRITGYDWTKPDTATFVIGDRVVKYWTDAEVVSDLAMQFKRLEPMAGRIEAIGEHFISVEYIPGVTMYQYLKTMGSAAYSSIADLLTDMCDTIWHRDDLITPDAAYAGGLKFYKEKTVKRLMMLDTKKPMVARAIKAFGQVDYDKLARAVIPGTFHGDFNFGNIIVGDSKIALIDPRNRFVTPVWGDIMYDFGKLIGGTYINWGDAQEGVFTRWSAGETIRKMIMPELVKIAYMLNPTASKFDIQNNITTIAAITLISSAPLHAEPLDELLVQRALEVLGDVR